MSDFTLTRTGIRAGEYEGVLTTRIKRAPPPDLVLCLLDKTLADVSITPDLKIPKRWSVRMAIPTTSITEGVLTFLVRDKKTAQTLDSFAIITGLPLEDDLRGDIALLRAELDMLKQAFRAHCRDHSV